MEENIHVNNFRTDKRINPNRSGIVESYDEIIQDYIDKNKINIPVIIHSDSYLLKHKFNSLNKKYIVLDLKIQHLGEYIGDNTLESYVDTITEFYIMSKSKSILTVGAYSGFSHISSLINKVPLLYKNFNSDMYELLHCDNITKI